MAKLADLPAIRQSGEIGRRAGFRILCLKRLGSSTLPSGTRLWQAGAHGLGPCGETLGGSSPLSGTKGDRKGRRCPRPPSRPAPQRLRTGKIRAVYHLRSSSSRLFLQRSPDLCNYFLRARFCARYREHLEKINKI